MKYIFLLMSLFLFCNVILAQNGVYKCNTQKFSDANDPSKNAEHNNSMTITIEINDFTGGSVIITHSDNFVIKYIILGKIQVTVNENGVKFTNYDARFNYENVQAQKQSIVSLVQDPRTNSFHLGVYNSGVETVTWYNDLTKIN